MRYICLGYHEERNWDEMSESERNRFMEECFAYDDVLRKSGHFVGCNRLQPPDTARTVRVRNGRIMTVDGPFAETKELFGGYYLIDARNMDEAVQVASRIPGAARGCVEVRPVAEDERTVRILGLAAGSPA